MTTYSVNSLEHQAVRSFFRRQSDRARRRRRAENIVAWIGAASLITLVTYLLIQGF